MPWYPDLFSAPVLERIRSQAADGRASGPVPYFAGVQSGETDALVGRSRASRSFIIRCEAGSGGAAPSSAS